MPGARGLPCHDLKLSGRTSEEAVYAESRRKQAIQAVVRALTASVSGYFFIKAGLLEADWIVGCLRGLFNPDSLSDLVSSLIVLFSLGFCLFVMIYLAWAAAGCLFPRELRIRPGDRSVLLRRVPFFGPTTERVIHGEEVDAVVLVAGKSWYDQYWTRLRLSLKSGGTVHIDAGRQTEELLQIAAEVAGALGAPLANR